MYVNSATCDDATEADPPELLRRSPRSSEETTTNTGEGHKRNPKNAQDTPLYSNTQLVNTTYLFTDTPSLLLSYTGGGRVTIRIRTPPLQIRAPKKHPTSLP